MFMNRLYAVSGWSFATQAIPENDQNASTTNQKTAGSKLDRTSKLMFYGSLRHLESFSGGFLCEYVCWDVFSDTW